VESGAARFYFLYLSELDMVLHHHAEPGGPVEARLQWYAEGLGAIFASARARDPHATLVVTSDHGMAAVRDRFDLVAEIESLGYSMPEDYLAVYDSTMARYWFFHSRAREAVESRLRSLSCGRVLSDAELESLGILFDDRRFGQTIFLLNPGCLIAKSDFNGTGWRPSGMHGYHPDDPYSDAVFLSNRQFASNPQTITDVYRCMREVI
jgi:predicted AlkP superfamily pyrophosphatase or phosphodiesterase